MANGDNDGGLDMSPLPGPGVTMDVVTAQQALLAGFDAAAAAAREELAKATKQADEDASLAALVEHIADLVVPVVNQVVTAHAAKAKVTPTPSMGSQLLGGLVQVSETPKDQRGAAITSLIQGILATAATRL